MRSFSIASAPHEDTLMVATRMRGTAFKRVLDTMPLSSVRNPGHVNRRSGNGEYGFREMLKSDSGGMWNANRPSPESVFKSRNDF